MCGWLFLSIVETVGSGGPTLGFTNKPVWWIMGFALVLESVSSAIQKLQKESRHFYRSCWWRSHATHSPIVWLFGTTWYHTQMETLCQRSPPLFNNGWHRSCPAFCPRGRRGMFEMQVYAGVLSGGAVAVGLCNQVVEWRLSLAGTCCVAPHSIPIIP